MFFISLNMGSFGNVCSSNIDRHHYSLSFLFSSLSRGFNVLEWRRSSPYLHLCTVLFSTPRAVASDLIILLLCKRMLRTSDRSICFFVATIPFSQSNIYWPALCTELLSSLPNTPHLIDTNLEHLSNFICTILF